jgi:putative SOS response-associated peptidase YedK
MSRFGWPEPEPETLVPMCGRFASGRDPDDLAVLFGSIRSGEAGSPSWNIAPTDRVQIVLERADRTAPRTGPVRQLRPARWGLVPFWSTDSRGAARRINARVETAAERPAFRRAFRTRRCLLPADGYYEWQRTPAGGKTPHFLRPRDRGVLAFAGLYELWCDPTLPPADPTAWLWTTTILTTAAIPRLAHLHDRMPVTVAPARYAAWLGPGRPDQPRRRGQQPGQLAGDPRPVGAGPRFGVQRPQPTDSERRGWRGSRGGRPRASVS